jgi:uncharacterized protein
MTSAGPTYFPIYNQRYVDGGVALNNPTMAALTFAINDQNDNSEEPSYLYGDGVKKGLGLKFADLHVLSLSTGTGNRNYIDASKIKTGNWGNIQWIRYLPDLLTESNMQSTLYYVKQVLDKDQYYRVELFFDDEAAPAVLKNKAVGLDAKGNDVLEGMHQFALDTFHKQKDEIAVFLGLLEA